MFGLDINDIDAELLEEMAIEKPKVIGDEDGILEVDFTIDEEVTEL